MSDAESAELVQDVIEDALDGNRVAFRVFYEHYDPSVRWAVGLRVHRWPQLVPYFDDIVQEVWWALIRRNGKRLRYHDSRRGVSFSRFLTLVAARVGWKIAKRRLSHPEMEPIDMEEDEEDEEDFARWIINAEFLDRLAELANQRLDPMDRSLFEGYYVHGERLKDIGARLGMNENTVYKRNERLQTKLRRLGEELLDAPKTKVSSELVAVILAMLCAISSSENTVVHFSKQDGSGLNIPGSRGSCE